MASPLIPTLENVSPYIQVFDINNRKTERQLSELFQRCPQNTEFEQVLQKVTLLDKLYNTGIKRFGREPALQVVAKHIIDLDVDSLLANGVPELVEFIARTPNRREYSFATKFCSWHMADAYPVYDSQVESLLWTYQQVEHFHHFRRYEIQNDYLAYKAVIEQFRQKHALESLGFKTLDKFLWQYSKDYFVPA